MKRRRGEEEKKARGGATKEWSDEPPRTTTKDSLSHADAKGRMEAIGMVGMVGMVGIAGRVGRGSHQGQDESSKCCLRTAVVTHTCFTREQPPFPLMRGGAV